MKVSERKEKVFTLLSKNETLRLVRLCRSFREKTDHLYGERTYESLDSSSRTNFDTIKRRKWIGPVVGEGMYSHAFKYPNDLILKTNFTSTERSKDSQKFWLEWCLENQEKYWVPKILFLYRVDHLKDDRFLVIMEELDDFENQKMGSSLSKNEQEVVEEVFESIGSVLEVSNGDSRKKFRVGISRVCESLSNHEELKDQLSTVFKSTYPQIYRKRIFKMMKRFLDQDEEILEVSRTIASLRKKHKCCLDIHTGNIMIRKASQNKWEMVVTDPLSYGES